MTSPYLIINPLSMDWYEIDHNRLMLSWLMLGMCIAVVLPEMNWLVRLLHGQIGRHKNLYSSVCKGIILGLLSPFISFSGGLLPIFICLAHLKCSPAGVITMLLVGQSGSIFSYLASWANHGDSITGLWRLLSPVVPCICAGFATAIHFRRPKTNITKQPRSSVKRSSSTNSVGETTRQRRGLSRNYKEFYYHSHLPKEPQSPMSGGMSEPPTPKYASQDDSPVESRTHTTHHHHRSSRRRGIPFGVWLQNVILRTLDIFGRVVFIVYISEALTEIALDWIKPGIRLSFRDVENLETWMDLVYSIFFRMGIIGAIIPLQLNQNQAFMVYTQLLNTGQVSQGLAFTILVLGPALSLSTIWIAHDITNKFSNGTTSICCMLIAFLVTATQLSYFIDYMKPELVLDDVPTLDLLPLWFHEYARTTAIGVGSVALSKASLNWFMFSKSPVKRE